ncbi:MAG TPA: tRNA-intron lyase [Candidatus Eisenbacteria bacterium]|nr:tRNA-intron lyase [Candidatus Eisenbacteria bacterium]
MNNSQESAPESSVSGIKGILEKKGVRITESKDIDQLSSRGYGVADDEGLLLAFHEALYLMDKGMLTVIAKRKKEADFQSVLKEFESTSENAWTQYLAYRDLRSRGYVVREGFGSGVDFRVYERGEYSKDAAKYLILNVQEGKPLSLEELARTLKQSQSLKKELVLAVMNRRGEVVYYSVSQLNLAGMDT